MDEMDEKYKKYLASKEWKKKWDERMRIDRHLCTDCDSSLDLVAHHIIKIIKKESEASLDADN